MRSRFAGVFALILAALAGGGTSARAGDFDRPAPPPKPLDIPTLVSRENQFLPAPSGPADRMFQNAQITSAANFSLSNNLDPIDIIGNQAGATGGLFRSAALATSPYVLLSNGGNYFSSTFA